jgi:hypothetical protein
MKTSLKLILLFLGASLPCIAFAGLVGLPAATTFFSGEVAFSVFAAVGLMLTGLNDYTYRRTAIRAGSVRACPVIAFRPDQSGPVCPQHRGIGVAA